MVKLLDTYILIRYQICSLSRLPMIILPKFETDTVAKTKISDKHHGNRDSENNAFLFGIHLPLKPVPPTFTPKLRKPHEQPLQLGACINCFWFDVLILYPMVYATSHNTSQKWSKFHPV